MWLIYGVLAMIFAILNIFNYKKKSDIFSFLSLAFTNLTTCVFYADEARRVVIEDWAGLMDTMPKISKHFESCGSFHNNKFLFNN